MAHQPIDPILNNPRLPTLPAVAVRVLELSRQPQIDLKQLADVIQNDQALTARIIRTVNSSYFGLNQRCGNIRQAIVYLGLNAVKMLALGFSLVATIRDDDDWQVSFDYMDYWRRSLHGAAAAREIAMLTNAWDAEEAFVAALLRDLGMIAFYRAYGDIYLQAIDLTEGDHSALVPIEERSLQTDHAKLGSKLTAHWNMPEQISQGICYHHEADAAPEQFIMLARVIQLADDAAAVIGDTTCKPPNTHAVDRFRHRSRTWFHLMDKQLQTLLSRVATKTAQLADLFSVDLAGPAEVDDLLTQAGDTQLLQHMQLDAQCKRLGMQPGRA